MNTTPMAVAISGSEIICEHFQFLGSLKIEQNILKPMWIMKNKNLYEPQIHYLRHRWDR